MYAGDFSWRLTQLREAKGVSARDMSLSIGQNAGYINAIENQKALPSMSVFFYICDYLGITPKEFFDTEVSDPTKTNELYALCRKLDAVQTEHLIALLKDLI